MHDTTTITLGRCTFDVLKDTDNFLGLGRISIGNRLIRSGRLPWLPYAQGFLGDEFWHCRLDAIEQQADRLEIRLVVSFRKAALRQATDYHLERVYDTSDWAEDRPSAESRLTLHIVPAADTFAGVRFDGFSYQWSYAGELPL